MSSVCLRRQLCTFLALIAQENSALSSTLRVHMSGIGHENAALAIITAEFYITGPFAGVHHLD